MFEKEKYTRSKNYNILGIYNIFINNSLGNRVPGAQNYCI